MPDIAVNDPADGRPGSHEIRRLDTPDPRDRDSSVSPPQNVSSGAELPEKTERSGSRSSASHASPASQIRVDDSTSDRPAWDAFAQACDASFRCAHQAARIWQFEHHVFFRTSFLDIHLAQEEGSRKIGQCAIGIGHRKRTFADALQLLPEYRHLWQDAMRAVLSRSGPGLYTYGSEWTLDPCRGEDLARIDGVSVKDVHTLDVQAIDFSAWPTWDAYYRAISTNAKRNAQKLERSSAALHVRMDHSWGVLPSFVPLQLSRYRLFKRKSVAASLPRLIGRSGLRLVATHTYSRLAKLTADDANLAFYLDIPFGRNTFFLEAAPAGNFEGASAYLLRAMINDSYARSGGRGRFVMGPDDHGQHGTPVWEGLKRSREQWRATAHPTSVSVFSYASDKDALRNDR